MTIVHRRSIDSLRKRAGKPAQAIDDEALAMRAPGPDPFVFASQAEERERVRNAMQALAPDQRQAIELTYFGGMTSSELAKETGAPVGTVKSRLRLGLRALRKSLAGEPT